ncbi:hypothetical protein [Lysinibacillus pakistanensis]|uniref:hypothetical protein n=1 Tax=Lysinibacillus pakistanensis TaxID=759811 RepID=UPI0024BFE4E6|nr:hypothetical protein [Lysinibacillus pakistanensis]WHY46003.1 hypothetical protein QNH22_22540 [Lysinibacillus pakistanensis]
MLSLKREGEVINNLVDLIKKRVNVINNLENLIKKEGEGEQQLGGPDQKRVKVINNLGT